MSTKVSVSCTDQKLTITAQPLIASGGVQEDVIEFSFCPLWDGFEKTAAFWRNDRAVYHVPIVDDCCVIPKEVTLTPGVFLFGVFGSKDNVTRTTEAVKYPVAQGAYTFDKLPDTTPNLTKHIQGKLKSLIERTVTAFSDDSVESIGAGAFAYAPELKSVSFPNVASVGDKAFIGCSKLAHVDLPAATSIGNNSFEDCAELESVDFPFVSNVGDRVFLGCKKLKTVNIPLLTTIGVYMFESCDALESADFPTVTSIKQNGFYGCDALIEANFPAVTSIGVAAFYNCWNLAQVNFPAATSINNRAFYGCANLAHVNFPVATTIGESAFQGCGRALASVCFPEATAIGSGAFYQCNVLTTADFPKLESIGDTTFQRCPKLTALILRNTVAVCTPWTWTDALTGTPIASGTGYIYVPAALLADYQADAKWSTYSAQFRALESYTVDGTVTGELDEAKVNA